jgi:hypothetical protein
MIYLQKKFTDYLIVFIKPLIKGALQSFLS